MHKISQILPPLSDDDNVALCVFLPLLAAALHGDLILPDKENDAMDTDQKTMEQVLAELAGPLSEFALSGDYEARSRASAASCLHAYVSSFSHSETECPVVKLQAGIINPLLISSMTAKSPDLASFVDALNLSSLLVRSRYVSFQVGKYLGCQTHTLFYNGILGNRCGY